ncbi:MAG: hypothetical protein ACT4P6_10945 [Gemmatimonadaceae bacterium]
MRFRLDQLSGSNLERAAQHFETHGYFMLEGVGEALTRHFKPLVAEQLMVDMNELERILEPDSPPVVLPEEIRKRMSRITSTPDLQQTLLTNLFAIACARSMHARRKSRHWISASVDSAPVRVR